MRPILKTNDAVLLSFAKDLLAQNGIESVVFDENASIMDGSLGILPRRLMVAEDEFDRAKRALDDGMKPVTPPEVTTDRFLGGKVVVRQFLGGLRSGLDAVLLAAAVPAREGESVLELGSGPGTASLCLAWRQPGVRVTGAEIHTELVTLSNNSATDNNMGDRVMFVTVDALDLPADMKRDYDHVFCNPPFHDASGERSPDAMRARATQDGGELAEWLEVGVKRTVSGGTFTTILRADRLGEALAALPSTGVTIYPFWPKNGEDAKRIILQVEKGSRAPLVLLPGLVLHNPDGSYTPAADAVLRGEAGLA